MIDGKNSSINYRSDYVMSRIAYKYAKVLLQLAAEDNVLAQVHAEMDYLGRLCTDSKHLVATLRNPIIEHNKKLSVLQAIFQNEAHELTLSFLAMVIQKHRAALLPTIIQAFLTQHDQHQGIKKAQVATTFPLSDWVSSQLQRIVQQIAPCQQVIFEQTIDPTLIGGYVLQVDDILLDRSLRKQLLMLQKDYVASVD